MKEKIISLLGVRSIITLALTGVLCYGFIVGKVEAKDFLVYVTMVFTFFFAKTGQEQAKEQIQEELKKNERSGIIMASNLNKEQMKELEKTKKENEEKQEKVEKIEDSEVIYGIVGGESDDTKSKKC